MTTTTLHEGLCQFFCTENYWQHSLKRWVVYTDGVKYLMEHGAAWLVDAVASYLPTPGRCMEQHGDRFAYFHVWYLRPNDGGAILEARADTDEPVVWKQVIEFTDFPFQGKPFKLYVAPENIGGEVKYVIMLPSEH